MPVYEYRCEVCAQRFSELVRSDDAAPACPACGHPATERLLSSFLAGPGRARRSDFTPARLRGDGGHGH